MRASLRRLALAFTSFRLKDPHLPAVLSSAQEIVGSSVHDESPDRKPATMTSDIHSKLGKFASKHGDALFGFIESAHIGSNSGDEGGAATFGSILDAGTGSHSLKWIASLIRREELLAAREDEGRMITLQDYTAITADEQMRRRVLDEASDLGVDDRGDVIIGNWVDEDLLDGKKYDTILADYLVGAIDGFSPFFQERIFERISSHLAPGGRLYVVGLQPIPDEVEGDGNVFCKITKVRDACILLAGHRCYREYPLDWIERHLVKSGLTVVDKRKYPIKYTYHTMERQINVARSKLKLFPTRALADSMGRVLDDLEKEAEEATSKQPDGRLTLGFDYVVVAERSSTEISS